MSWHPNQDALTTDPALLQDELDHCKQLIEQLRAQVPSKPRGDPRFHELLLELGWLHDKKQDDYGRTHDPFSNVRASEDFGIPGWVGAIVRANDKMRRLQKAAQGHNLANESIEDSLKDLAVYSLIALILLREETDPL